MTVHLPGRRPILWLIATVLVQLLLVPAFSPPASAAQSAQSAQSEPDLEGTPNMIVRKELGQKWKVRNELMEAGTCEVVEGGITPGERSVVRFTVMVANIGDADVSVGDPNEQYMPTADNPCRYLDPATGLCHALPESDYSDNITETTITVPSNPGPAGYGPLST